MDERSFDNLVRDLAASAQSRRALGLAAFGLALSLAAPLAPDTDAARRRQARREKRRKSGKGNQGGSGKGNSNGKGPQNGHQDDCGEPNTCTRDPKTGESGYTCPDGRCSCGGSCCEKGYACFVERSTPGREVCCFEGANQVPSEKEDLIVCPGVNSDPNVCCESSLCNDDGTCSYLLFGRYRRNPR